MNEDRSVRSTIRLNSITVVGFAIGLAILTLGATLRMGEEASTIRRLDTEFARLAEIKQIVESSVRLCTEGLAFKSDSVHAEILGNCEDLQTAFDSFMRLTERGAHEGELGAAASMLPEFPPLISAIRSDMITFISLLKLSKFDEASAYYRERLDYRISRVAYFVNDMKGAISSARMAARYRAEFTITLAGGLLMLALSILTLIVLLNGRALSRLVLSPISSIQEVIAKIQPGQLAGVIPRTRVIEFQLLVEQFNEMGVRLEINERELHGNARTLEKTQERLELANQAQREFMAVASHELKTPVTSIRSFAEILLNFCADESVESQREFLEIIHNEAIRLTRLIDRLLDLARIDAGVMTFEPERIDLREVIHASLDTLRHAAADRGIQVCADLPEDEAGYYGDKDRLLQVMINLIGNAIKFGPEGSTVSVKLESVRDGFEIAVADHGPGVADAVEKVRIFERFVQSGDHLTDRPQGTGLGLAICREILELHDARIECLDNEGGGARFLVSLPRVTVPIASLSPAGNATPDSLALGSPAGANPS